MTPELFLAVGPSVVAIAVAGIGAFTQWRARIADDARFAAQREADNLRYTQQREADESRMRLQIQAEADAVAAAHLRAVELRALEERAAVAHEQHERLRQEAATFVTVFGEAQSAVASIAEGLQRAVSANDWDSYTAYFAAWTSDLQARLAAATAIMRLIGGDDVAQFASIAYQHLRDDVASAASSYKERDSTGFRFLGLGADQNLRNFTEAVSAELDALTDGSGTSGGDSVHASK